MFPVMGYTPAASYSALDNSAIFPAPTGPTGGGFQTYQPALDGNVYAIQQPMLYSYPGMDPEVSGYFVPMFEQAGAAPREAGLIPTPGATLYAPTNGATVMTAYPSAPIGAPASIYPAPVMYAPSEQYPPGTPGTPQYPMGYPVTYPYPYNGPTYQPYWGPMATYYVPQGAPFAAAAPQPQSSTPHNTVPPCQTPTSQSNTQSVNYNNGGGNCNGTKRGTPPQTGGILNNHSFTQTNSSAGTPTGIMTFPPPPYTQPVPLANTGATPAEQHPPATAMYAIPQPIFQVPYQTATHMPQLPSMQAPPPGHPNHNQTVINKMATPPPPVSSTATVPHQVVSQQMPAPIGQESVKAATVATTAVPASAPAVTNRQSSSYNRNSNGTPQSAPSTPLAIPIVLPLAPPPQSSHQKHPPLFPTPPLMPNGYVPQHHRSFDNYDGGYDKKPFNSNGNRRLNTNFTPNGRPNNVVTSGSMSCSGGNVAYPSQSSNYVNPRKSVTNNVDENTAKTMYNPKRGYNSNNYNGTGGNNSSSSPHTAMPGKVSLLGASASAPMPPQDKPRGMRGPKPANLDLRRSNSQRNTPSTNSNESNNSPNSLSSGGGGLGGGGGGMMLISGGPPGNDHSHSMYMQRGQHIPSTLHHQYHVHSTVTTSAGHQANAAIAHAIESSAGALAGCQQSLISTTGYNPNSGMYVKYFAHVSFFFAPFPLLK